MNFLFRVDGSPAIGGGHIMRCINLADKLKSEKEVFIVFVCRDLSKSHQKKITDAGHNFVIIGNGKDEIFDENTDAVKTKEVIKDVLSGVCQCIIVDQYHIGSKWHKRLREYTKKILVIDDLANRKLECDILLNQNYCTEITKTKYKSLVTEHCKMFCGLEYLLLGKSFLLEKETKRQVRGENIKNILIFFGLGDVGGEVLGVLKVLQKMNFQNLNITVVIGKETNQHNQIMQLCKKIDGCIILTETEAMAELVNKSDFCIGSAGMNMWERAYLGLPSLVTAIATNQVEAMNIAEEFKIIIKASNQFKTGNNEYTKILTDIFIKKQYSISNLSKNCYSLFKGNETKAFQNLMDSIIEP